MKVSIVNTHPGENPLFVDGLKNYLSELGLSARIKEGYRGENPLDGGADRVFLTGVPLDVGYSLTQGPSQRLVEEQFGWLRDCSCPVMGICYGFQILAHIFGGQVEKLGTPVQDEGYPLELVRGVEVGIFKGINKIDVFAEHSDYVSDAPGGFHALARKGEVIYIIYNPEREMYGLQFVPEFSGAKGRSILRRFLEG